MQLAGERCRSSLHNPCWESHSALFSLLWLLELASTEHAACRWWQGCAPHQQLLLLCKQLAVGAAAVQAAPLYLVKLLQQQASENAARVTCFSSCHAGPTATP